MNSLDYLPISSPLAVCPTHRQGAAESPGVLREVRYLVIHCSATRADRDYPVSHLLRDHRARHFFTIGYHFYIRKSGELTQHRALTEVGAHAKGYNWCSIGICYEGGLDADGHPADTRTMAQRRVLRTLIARLRALYPQVRVVGHRDLPQVHKACPCFDAAKEYNPAEELS